MCYSQDGRLSYFGEDSPSLEKVLSGLEKCPPFRYLKTLCKFPYSIHDDSIRCEVSVLTQPFSILSVCKFVCYAITTKRVVRFSSNLAEMCFDAT
ncbi:hypothetical protein AVEN_239014-1 [Araneus ventricosus]|uniref:Uncharacterized protein n=1 Tax=Araneus ventricosus TaxID=182803 RepID=A0A4Y2UCG8_ARAVE|nr:hypothetical protein AVEN_239014-1 [Araneus ventricosus]